VTAYFGERLSKLDATYRQTVRCDQFGVTSLSARVGTSSCLNRPKFKLGEKGEHANLFSLRGLAVEGATESLADKRPRFTRLQYSFNRFLVGERGFEPPTPWSRTRCSTRLSHSPNLRLAGCLRIQRVPGWRFVHDP
jgi:hypothetical protein